MNALEYDRMRRKENDRKKSLVKTPESRVPLPPSQNQSRSGSSPVLLVQNSCTPASPVRSLKLCSNLQNPPSRQPETNNLACIAESSAMAQQRAELLQDCPGCNAAYPNRSWGSCAESSDVTQRTSGGSQGSFHSSSNLNPTQHSGHTVNYQTDRRTRSNIIQQSSGDMYFPRDYFSPIPHTSEPSSTAGVWPRDFYRQPVAIASSHTKSYRGSPGKHALPQTIDTLSNKYNSVNDAQITQPIFKEQWDGGNGRQMIQEFENLRISQNSGRKDSKGSQSGTSQTEGGNITQQTTRQEAEHKFLIRPSIPTAVSSDTGRVPVVSSTEKNGQLQAQPQSRTCDLLSPLMVAQEIRTENKRRQNMEARLFKGETPGRGHAQAPSTSYSRGQKISFCRNMCGLHIIKCEGFILKHGAKKAVKLLLELSSISTRCRVGNDVAYREALRKDLGARDFMRYMDEVDDWVKFLQVECTQPWVLKSIEEDSWTAFVWRGLNNIFKAQYAGQDIFPELLDAYLRAPSNKDKRDLNGACVSQSRCSGFENETCPMTTKSSNEYSNESPDSCDQDSETIYVASRLGLSTQSLKKTEHTRHESKGERSLADDSLRKRENIPTGSTGGRSSDSMNKGKDESAPTAEHASNPISANDPTRLWPWSSLCIPPLGLVSPKSEDALEFSSILNKSDVKVLAPLPSSSGVFSGSGWRCLPDIQCETPEQIASSPRQERNEPSFNHLEDIPLSPASPPIDTNEGEWVEVAYDESGAGWVDIEAEREDIVGKKG